MKIQVINTRQGLVPMYDDDFDEKQKLQLGEIYEAEIRPQRNIRFHRLFFALINCAWEYLPEKVQKGFRTKESFRKSLEILAGYTEQVYSPLTGEWLETPRSISFESMDEAEFKDLYRDVKRSVFDILGNYVGQEEFENNLSQF